MNIHDDPSLFSRAPRRNLMAFSVAFMSTLLALPVNAGITIPDDPLTTGSRVAPNVLLILDDSGSMAWRNINNRNIDKITGVGNFSDGPDANGVNVGTGKSSESSGNDAMYEQNYVTNTLYYNPANDYQAWMGPDGNRLTGGTDYTKVYSDSNYVTYAGQSGGSKDLADNTQTFYVPKDVSQTDSAYLSDVENYYRYQIPGGGNSIVRSVWGAVVDSGWVAVGVSPDSGYVTGSSPKTHTISGVPGDARLYLQIKSTNSRHAKYELKDSGGNTVCVQQFGDSDTRVCDLQPTVAGGYTLYVTDAYPDNNKSYYELSAWYRQTNRCGNGNDSYDWIDCEYGVTPTGRTLAAEKANFATWYSYHRTRMKAAKAGASVAFRPLGNGVRVGFNTIWDRVDYRIPVQDGNDGRFVNNIDDPNTPANESTTSRTDWYESLFSAAASNGTPLRAALNRAGAYFKESDADGPYGPEAGADQLSCRQNFAILTTDGYWNSDSESGGNSDNTAGVLIKGVKGATYTYSPAAPYSDSYANTLADVAMKYWKTDLRTESYMGNSSSPDGNNVPTTDADPAFWQHMVTFGISIGLETSKGWSSTTEARDAIAGGDSWPSPRTDDPNNDYKTRLDDLLHAAVNGRGEFVAATNPQAFSDGLTKALAAISQRTSSFSNVATNAASVRSGGKVFNASYVSGLWTGAVRAWTLDSNNNPDAQAWEASIPAVASRKVFTYGSGSGATFPTSAQITALDRSGLGPANYEISGSDNAAYIKGDASNEERNGGLLRNRTDTVLGDVVNSSPFYVDDTNTLYVGANDGMLHAFDAADGDELFAYVPSLVNFSDLSTLSRGDYTHKWFVDGPIAVTSRRLTPSENWLIGAMGRGGKGLYGLNVSTPGAFAVSDVAWELAETVNGNMGYVTGRPILAMVKTGAATKVAAAIVGNGVNSSNNKAVLLIVNVKTGEVIRELDTGAGSAASPNGLSAPTGILGPDGKSVAYVYAGDRLGNVWKFDLTSSSPGGWTVTRMFTAKSDDGAGAVQPITGGVTVATDPRTYKRWVFFGTGSYMTTAEADDKTAGTQGMYGIIDTGAALSYSDLEKRGFSNTGASQDGYPVRSFDAKDDLPSDKLGWYLTLPGKGERIVQDAQLVGNILVTASMIPEGDACEAAGTGYINALDAFTGTSAGSSFFDLDGDGDTSDTSVGGVPVGSVNFGVGMPTLPIILDGKLIVGGTNAGEKPGAGGIHPKSWSRVSWREIRND